jgi:hypothetical protein
MNGVSRARHFLLRIGRKTHIYQVIKINSKTQNFAT